MDEPGWRSAIVAVVLGGSALLASSGALAQPTPPSADAPAPNQSDDAQSAESVEGVIVDVRKDELIIDLGTDDGLPKGARVAVFRRLEVTHPVTEEQVTDRFFIGELTLDRTGKNLSIATNWDQLQRLPSVQDHVVWHATRSPKQAESSEATDSDDGDATDAANQASAESSDKEASDDKETDDAGTRPSRSQARIALDETFQKTLGKPLSERISLWQQYLEDHPDASFAEEVDRELKWLRQRREAFRKTEEKLEAQRESEEPAPLTGKASAPEEVHVGDPLYLSAVVDEPSRIEQVRALVRRSGEPTYETLPMSRSGDHNWRIQLNDDWVNPGSLEYFVEYVRSDGGTRLLDGSTSSPNRISISEPVEDPAPTSGRSRATGLVEYVNFKSGEGKDQFLRLEADYRYELDFKHFQTFRVGAGIFDGAGASIATVESGGETDEVNISYGFAEGGFSFGELFAVSARLLAGNHTSPQQRTLESAFGVQLRARVGKAAGTRLTLGGALTEQIGNEAWINFAMEAFEKVPMSGEVTVTNLPVGADLGVSLNYGIGYRLAEWLTVSGRVGWNARTIDYQGPSAGIGTRLDW